MKGRIAVRKIEADIPEGRSPKQGIHNGVQQDIGIRMPEKPFFIGNPDSAKD